MTDDAYLRYVANLMLQHVIELQHICEFQRLYGKDKTEMLVKVLGEIQIDIVGIQEIIYKKEKKYETE